LSALSSYKVEIMFRVAFMCFCCASVLFTGLLLSLYFCWFVQFGSLVHHVAWMTCQISNMMFAVDFLTNGLLLFDIVEW